MKPAKSNNVNKLLLAVTQIVLFLISVTFSTAGVQSDLNHRESSSLIIIQDKIDDECRFNGMKLYGKIQFVTSFPDLKVQVVESFPDLKVQIVEAFPDKCGKWQIVNSFPDLKVQIVESFPDIKIKFVESFPGNP